MPSEIICKDLNQQALQRLATQFKESPNLIGWILSHNTGFNEIESVLCDLKNNRWIDTAKGKQLDIIGIIVGQPRTVISASNIKYFGFDGFILSRTFSSVNNPTLGGRFVSVRESFIGERELTDDEYRLFIRARILSNKSNSTIQEIIDIAKTLFNAPEAQLIEGTNSYTLKVGKLLTPSEQYFLISTDIMSKPAGVSAQYAIYDPQVSGSEISVQQETI